MFLQRVLQMARQASVYSVAWLSQSIASILLLPIYTAHLTPTDYGIVQMLDYTVAFAQVAVLVGLVPAIYRFFNDTEDESERRLVVSTGLVYVAGAGLIATLVLLALQGPVTHLVLGEGVDPSYTRLALYGLFADLLLTVPMAYFAVRGRAGVYLRYALGRLVTTIGFSVWFIVGLDLGAKGMIGGALAGSAIFAVLMLVHTLRETGIAFDRERFRGMVAFGLPMVPATIGGWLMHNVDRYILRAVAGTDAVGIYTLGYKFPFMVSSLMTSSFNLVWSSRALYDIAKDPDANQQYARIATYYMVVFVFFEFALAVVSTSVVTLLVDEAYYDALMVVPVVCAGMCFFTFHQFVVVGAFLHKRTKLLPIGHLVAAAVNCLVNLWAIPRWGFMGAAWVSVLTYGCYSTVNYFVFRNIYRIDFQFSRLAHMLGVAVALYLLYQWVPHHGVWLELAQQVGFVLLFPLILLGTRFLHPEEVAAARGLIARRLGGTP